MPPRLAVHAVHVDQRECAEQRDVRAAQERVKMMRGKRCAEEDEGGGEEGGRGWQKWPVTIVTGAYLGYALGKILGGTVFKGKKIMFA